VIGGGTLATNGEVSLVPAHTLAKGRSSNLAAYAIYGPCCRAYVQVENTSAFTGGTDARAFQAASTQDLTQATSILKTHLDQSMQAAMQAQRMPGETLLPLSCSEQVSSNHQAGQEAHEVRVSVQETCQGVAVEMQAWKRLIMTLLDQQAGRWNTQYAFVGRLDVHTGKIRIGSDGQQASVPVGLAATYAYHFSGAEISHMKHLIAGKPVEVARTLLEQVPGMDTQGVMIEITGGKDTNRIPDDPTQIEMNDVFFGGPL
jgi:hypothetical protein